MPRNHKEELIFGTIMCGLMVLGMSAYNLTIHNAFAIDRLLIGFIPGFIVAFILDNFIVGILAKKITFKLPLNLGKKWQVIITLSFFMVLGMVTLMSVYGLVAQGQFHGDILPKYLRAWGFNFIMALPLQLIIVGPISRYFLQKIQNNSDAKKA